MRTFIAHFVSLILIAPVYAQASASSSVSWEIVDKRTHHETLCEAYIDQGSYLFRTKSCSVFGCDEWEYTIKTYCGKSEDGVNSATLEHWKLSSIFSTQSISESKWEEFHGNLLRNLAATAQSYGQTFTLKNVELDASGQLHVYYEIKSQSAIIEEGYWILGNGPSIPQVIERHTVRTAGIKEETTDVFVR